MTSFLCKKIVEQYNLCNNQKLTTQDIKKISKEQNVEERDVLKLLGVSSVAAYKCLKGIDCNFYVHIYSQEELEEISKKIRKQLAQFSKLDANMIKLLKNQYHIGSIDLRKILDANYVSYRKAEEQNHYLNIAWKSKKDVKADEIINKWKAKDTITYKSIVNIHNQYGLDFEEIRDVLNISKKSFESLMARKNKKLKINLYTEQDKQKCRDKISNVKKYRLSKKALSNFADEEKISINKAGEILGIKNYNLKKLMEDEKLSVKVVDEKTKRKVEELALDLKYLENNKERYYGKDELLLLCLMHNVSIDDMFFYLANSKTMYSVYKEAFENNPNGVWIGGKARISNDYINDNYKVLNYYITKLATNVGYIYECNNDDVQNLISEAFEYILNTGGIFEKNLFHDTKKLNKALIKNLKYVMIAYLNKMPRELSLSIEYDGIEFENQEILADQRYNPELCYLEEKHSYLREIDDIHKEIVREISRNDILLIEHPKVFFSRLARKYKMAQDTLEMLMSEIRALIFKNKLAKMDKNGNVIPMIDVDETEQ